MKISAQEMTLSFFFFMVKPCKGSRTQPVFCATEIAVSVTDREYHVSLEQNKVFPENEVINKVVNGSSLLC